MAWLQHKWKGSLDRVPCNQLVLSCTQAGAVPFTLGCQLPFEVLSKCVDAVPL